MCVWHFSSLKIQWRSSTASWKSKPLNASRTRSNSLAFSRPRTRNVSCLSSSDSQSDGWVPSKVCQIIHKEDGPSGYPVLDQREGDSLWDAYKIMQNRQGSRENTESGPRSLALKTRERFREERKAFLPLFLPARQPTGFSPNIEQILCCLPNMGSSCGHHLESFSVTWTALEETLGRDGLSSCSTMWKIAGQALLTTKAACNSTPHPSPWSL